MKAAERDAEATGSAPAVLSKSGPADSAVTPLQNMPFSFLGKETRARVTHSTE